jgi:hypothetical protein
MLVVQWQNGDSDKWVRCLDHMGNLYTASGTHSSRLAAGRQVYIQQSKTAHASDASVSLHLTKLVEKLCLLAHCLFAAVQTLIDALRFI